MKGAGQDGDAIAILSYEQPQRRRDGLYALIDRAMDGEQVVITRHGRPVVELRAIQPVVGPFTDAALDWLIERRVRSGPFKEDAGMVVSRMRDEDWR